jgi:hypothetical protein
MNRLRILFSSALLVLALSPRTARAQCRTTPSTGASTYTQVAGLPVAGTSLSGTSSLDGVGFQVSNVGGVLTTPTVRLMASTMIENGYSDAADGPAFYGVTFVNPTAASITVTRVDFASTLTLFQAQTGRTPTTGWSNPSTTLVRWTGSTAVAANSTADFIFSSDTRFTTAAQTPSLTVTVTAGGSTFSTPAFPIQEPGSVLPYGANAVVGFDTVGAGTWAPQISIASGVGANTVVNLPIRVRETGDNQNANNGIGTNLNVTITIPAGWSNVSMPTIAAPWRAASLAIVQPTLFSNGSVSITTNAAIATGTNTNANSLVLRATTPAASFSTSLFPFTFQLNGTSGDGVGPVQGKNEAIVKVNGSGSTTINAQFKSAPLATPVRQIVFEADVDVTGGTGSDSLNVDVFNNTTASWTTFATITPTVAFTKVTTTFTSNFAPYLDGSSQMSVRVVETGTPTRTVGIDLLSWTVTTGYTVNNFTGSDLNAGNVASPFKSLAKAATVLTPQGAVYVDVGSSQTGTPYDVNVTLKATQAGTVACSTVFQGVSAAGLAPLLQGTNPASDGGFTLQGNNQQVDGFQIQNVQVGLGADVGVSNAIISNNYVIAGSGGYGIILNDNAGSQAINNRVDGLSAMWVGIWDYSGTGDVLDGNKVLGFLTDGLRVDLANGVIVQRNITRGNYIGLHVANSSGTVTLYNNTSDANTYLGFYSEGATGTVTSRNNVITNNAFGWGWDGDGTISSNYDDVFANTNNYNYHGVVTPGANNISSSPGFVQTSNPALATYYALPSGSSCRDTGLNVGLPFVGFAPDRGATEQ